MNQYAFTFIETLVTLFIMSVVTLMSITFLHNFMLQSQDDLLRMQLLNAITFAEQEADARHTPIVLCGSMDGHHCSNAWSTGWLIFINDNKDGVVNNKDDILATYQVSNSGTLQWRGYPIYRNFLLFQSTEALQHDNGTFWYCRSGDAHPLWAIALSKSGRTRILESKDTNVKSLLCLNKNGN